MVKIYIFVLSLFYVQIIHALNLPYEAEEQGPSKKEQFIVWLHNRHSPKHVGIDDPDLPAFMQFRPTLVSLPHGYLVPDNFIIINDYLELRSLTPQILEKLSYADLKNLLNYLATVELEIKYTNNKGDIKSGKKHKIRKTKHWEKSNAATALVLNMVMQSQYELFVTMMALVPEATLPSLHGHLFGLLNPQIMAEIISAMLLRLNNIDDVGLSGFLSKQIGLLIRQGLVYWVNKDVRMLNDYLGVLLSEATQAIEKHAGESKEQPLGILLGSVLAGAMKHTEAIKKTDEKRIWVVGIVANLAWAATTFIGAAPMAAPFVAATAGSLSVGAVLSASVLTALDFPRDYTPTIKEIEGSFEMAALEASRSKNLEEKINMLLMFKWMQAAIHINGLSD